MDKEEHKKLENWVQRISWRLSFALSLGRVILECYRDSNVKESDIEGLIIVMNVCLKTGEFKTKPSGTIFNAYHRRIIRITGW